MAITIKDKNIDKRLNEIIDNIKRTYGFTIGKTDAIRYLLRMDKQGKKTSKKWGELLR